MSKSLIPNNDWFLGFETMFKNLNESCTLNKKAWPPHNKKVGENSVVLEFAVAGFSKEDLSVSLNKNTLIVSGHKDKKDDAEEYSYQGFAYRSFYKTFNLLSELIEEITAKLDSGVLTVTVKFTEQEQNVPIFIDID
jgi:molecular chaperone IbpA